MKKTNKTNKGRYYHEFGRFFQNRNLIKLSKIKERLNFSEWNERFLNDEDDE